MIETTTQAPIKNQKGILAIRPYFEGSRENMGLEKYNLSLFDGAIHEEQISCIENGGVKRYKTGLNEFAPEITAMPKGDAKDAKVKQIRETVAQLEKEIASNIVDPKSKDFWNELKELNPSNEKFWDGISIKCGNQPTFLDPTNPIDRIKIYAIKDGGFSIVAKSFEDARKRTVPPKFYLDELEETMNTKTELKKLRNKALTQLESLANSDVVKLLYVAKLTDLNSTQYYKSTPTDVLYENMDKFINGDSTEKNKLTAAKTFLSNAQQESAVLKVRCIIKDAIYYKLIKTKTDNFMYHESSSTKLGRNVSEVLEYLQDPSNDSILGALIDNLDHYWNK